MIPQEVELRFDTFDIIHQDDSGPDEPYVWTFYVKLDGTVIDLLHPQNSSVQVHSPAGSHGDLKLSDGEMMASDAPRSIPTHVGRWQTTLEQGNLLNLVIPQIAVAALIVGWEEDVFPSTAAMEEARASVRKELSDQLTAEVRKIVQSCLSDPANCSSNVDFESEISVDRLQAVILDVLKDKMAGFISGAVLLNPLFAVVGDRDEFIGYGVAGPFFLPKILGSSDFRQDFTLELRKGEPGTPGHYRVKGHLALLEPKMFPQPAAVEDDATVKVIARDPVVDKFFMSELGDGEISPFRHIGEGKFKSGPAAVLSSDGKLMHCFGLGLDDHFWRAWSNDGGKDWQLAWKQMPNGLFTSPPAAAMSGDGKFVKVFGRGRDDRIWMSSSVDGGNHWSSWEAIGQSLFISGPTACCSSDGRRLHVFGTGRDNRVYQTLSINGGKSWQTSWNSIHSATVDSAPAAVCSDDGKKVRVFARRGDKRIFWAMSDEGGFQWRGWWGMQTGKFISSPAVSMSRDGKRIHVFALGENMLLYQNGSSDFGGTYHEKFSRVDDNSTFY
jgi:hypothetical protein